MIIGPYNYKIIELKTKIPNNCAPYIFLSVLAEVVREARINYFLHHVLQDDDATNDIFNLRKNTAKLTWDWSKIYCMYHLSRAIFLEAMNRITCPVSISCTKVLLLIMQHKNRNLLLQLWLKPIKSLLLIYFILCIVSAIRTIWISGYWVDIPKISHNSDDRNIFVIGIANDENK